MRTLTIQSVLRRLSKEFPDAHISTTIEYDRLEHAQYDRGADLMLRDRETRASTYFRVHRHQVEFWQFGGYAQRLRDFGTLPLETHLMDRIREHLAWTRRFHDQELQQRAARKAFVGRFLDKMEPGEILVGVDQRGPEFKRFYQITARQGSKVTYRELEHTRELNRTGPGYPMVHLRPLRNRFIGEDRSAIVRAAFVRIDCYARGHVWSGTREYAGFERHAPGQ